MRREVTVRAPGKVNLQLSVGARGVDGFHPLATVFQAVDLFEFVTAKARGDDAITVVVESSPHVDLDVSAVPLDDTNVAVRAARAVADAFGISDGVDLRIIKGVPVAGGMAGGSADAAAALVACAEVWDVGASRADLLGIAATLGADVPFVLQGHTAVGLGRGDQLSPAMTHGAFHWVFATQANGLSTPDVYAAYDGQIASGERDAADLVISDEVMHALITGDAYALGAALTNDLQDAALELAPHLRDTIEAALEAEAAGAIVSGSGPTIAALARSRQHALAIAAHLKATGTAHVAICASGPAAGATVVA